MEWEMKMRACALSLLLSVSLMAEEQWFFRGEAVGDKGRKGASPDFMVQSNDTEASGTSRFKNRC